MINCFQFCFNFAFNLNLRRYSKETNLQAPMSMVSAGPRTACLPFHLNLTFCCDMKSG